MPQIHVDLNKTTDNSYDIVIGQELLGRIAEDIAAATLGHKYAVITDSNVEKLYGIDLLDELLERGLDACMIPFPAGERYKSRETKSMLEDRMLELGFARDSAIIALGGGVPGDIAGYVAATYARGIPYVQVPTTLVACVDSSVGGKTAVDTPHGKNLIGAFHQPWRVYADIDTLKTLSRKEMREGLAEVIKYGVIWDGELFKFLEGSLDLVFGYENEALEYIVTRGCEIKGEVVERDEHESNLRKVLNYGHTVGHAVENLSDYTITHGEAISIGMVAEGNIASAIGLISQDEVERIKALLAEAELPTEMPPDQDISEIIEVMKLDKKSRGGQIEMALPQEIGVMSSPGDRYGIAVEEDIIRTAIA